MAQREAEISILCGVDVGGTFTDLVLVDVARGRVLTEKLPTTADDPSKAIVAGLMALRNRLSLDQREAAIRVVHATTLVTNALIERKGANIALLTTRGFADVLDFQRENRFDIFDLAIRFPKPLVEPAMRWEVPERIGPDGEEVEPLDEAAVRRAAAEMRARGVEAVAVAFLHAYCNAEHERAAGRLIRETLGSPYVCLSGEVAPHIREYERFTTTTVNAYVMPLVDEYLAKLHGRLECVWPGVTLSLMVSNGGVCSPETARRFPVRLLESGPVAGALVAAHFGKLAETQDVLAFDMGGTTAKLCVVRDSRPNIIAQFEADRTSRFKRGSGLPILVPSVDLVEIGAGGGSIAWIDNLGLLQVGPRSASARPGPACYGFGGTEPTVTDADLVLGYLDPQFFLGGKMALDVAAAENALRKIADPLKVDVEQAAWGIHDLVNENMASAAWLHMAEKGLDPRTFVLVATGGAGPVHACHIAVKLGIQHVLCPPASGVASAFGLVIAPPKADVSRSFLSSLEVLDFEKLNAQLEELQDQALDVLLKAGVERRQVSYSRVADMLYRGQTHHIEVTLPPGKLMASDREQIARAFHEAYHRVYGTSLSDAGIDVVAVRVTAKTDPPSVKEDLFAHDGAKAASEVKRLMYAAAERCKRPVPVFRRDSLREGSVYDGPALIESPDTTVVVEPEWHFSLSSSGALRLSRRQQAASGKERHG